MLAERRTDLLPAARAFLRAEGIALPLSAAAREALMRHPFRGNFRELENVLKRGALEAQAAGARSLEESHLGLAHASEPEAVLTLAARSGWTLRKLTDAYIQLVLEECGGNVAEAARRLGVARKTLYARGHA